MNRYYLVVILMLFGWVASVQAEIYSQIALQSCFPLPEGDCYLGGADGNLHVYRFEEEGSQLQVLTQIWSPQGVMLQQHICGSLPDSTGYWRMIKQSNHIWAIGYFANGMPIVAKINESDELETHVFESDEETSNWYGSSNLGVLNDNYAYFFDYDIGIMYKLNLQTNLITRASDMQLGEYKLLGSDYIYFPYVSGSYYSSAYINADFEFALCMEFPYIITQEDVQQIGNHYMLRTMVGMDDFPIVLLYEDNGQMLYNVVFDNNIFGSDFFPTI